MSEQPKRGSIGVSTAIGAAWVVSWRLLSRLLGVISIVILSRLLSPDTFGVVAIATSLIGALDAFSVIGWQDAVIRSHHYRKDLLNAAFTISAARGVLMAIVIAAAAPFAGEFFSDDRLVPILYLLAGLTALEGLENVGPVEFRRNLAFEREFVQFAIPRFLAFVVTIYFAYSLRDHWALVLGIVAGRLAKFAASYLMHPFRPRFSATAIREILGFSLWTWAASMAIFVKERTPAFVIGRTMNADAVGRFTLGQEIAMLPITEVVYPVSRALFSGMASAHRDGRELGDAFCRAVGVLSVLILPLAIGISSVAHFVVAIALGATWRDVTPLIQLLGIAAPFSILTTICGTCLISVARLRGNFAINAVAAAFVVVLVVVLVTAYGLVGAISAVCIVMTCEGLLATGLTLHWLGGNASDLLAQAWRPVVAVATMAIVLGASGYGWPAQAATASTTLADLVVAVLLGAATYVLALALLWQLSGRPQGPERWLLSLLVRALDARRGVS
ncbi:MAG: oligosaccharide flippase family protein [Alphaproteobacteria bacterium]|nr:oligosaccharide flippase family protein [Alphaproteobacteria bacterium]